MWNGPMTPGRPWWWNLRGRKHVFCLHNLPRLLQCPILDPVDVVNQIISLLPILKTPRLEDTRAGHRNNRPLAKEADLLSRQGMEKNILRT